MFVAREHRLARSANDPKDDGVRKGHGATLQPLQVTSELIGRRWSAGIVNRLAVAPQRFNRLKTSLLGISSKTLSVNLKQLERDGVIHRKEVGSRPLRVEYELTEKGRDFIRVLDAMSSWGEKWHAFSTEEGRTPA